MRGSAALLLAACTPQAAQAGLLVPIPGRSVASSGVALTGPSPRRLHELSVSQAMLVAIMVHSHIEALPWKVRATIGVISLAAVCHDVYRPFALRFLIIPTLQGQLLAKIGRIGAHLAYIALPEWARPDFAAPRVAAAAARGASWSATRPLIASRRVTRRVIRSVPKPQRSRRRRAAASAAAHAAAHAAETAEAEAAAPAAAPPAVASAGAAAPPPSPAPPAAAPTPTVAAPTAPAAAATAAAAKAKAAKGKAAKATPTPPNFMPSPLAASKPLATASEAVPLGAPPKKRVLILISDTGGGHRASAQALQAVLAERHGPTTEVAIVDVWTAYGPWPYKNMVRDYRYMAKRPKLWYTAFKATSFTPTSYFASRLMSTVAYRGFEACMREFQPDVVVSMHPLCQAVPIKVLRAMERQAARELLQQAPGAERAGNELVESKQGQSGPAHVKRVPFVTVVTDLATPHPFWLHRGADLCFVPSESFMRAAAYRGLKPSQLRQHGLPVRPTFSAPADEGRAACKSLGLLPDCKTVLVVGGGDGMGRLGAIVEALGKRLSEHAESGELTGKLQMVVICGKNAPLRRQLSARSWGPKLHVVVEGFVTRMNDYMAAADLIVTKAGPGTIAEASCCGLPVMLSGHLPGQESGNVDFVTENGFGSYSRDPEVIAHTVCGWLEEPETLKRMSERAKHVSRPGATVAIADDIVSLMARAETMETEPSRDTASLMGAARSSGSGRKKARGKLVRSQRERERRRLVS